MRLNPTVRCLLTLACVIACSGCGGSRRNGKLPTLIPVKGRVTYKGKPIEKGTVKFEPDGYGRNASGRLQSDGTFVLTTLKDGDGVVAGQHRVTVTDTGVKSSKDVLANKWASAAASGLTAEVDPDHTEFTFELK